ncbi:MAG: tRNA pseudouridine(13) synthase TruD [Labilithrix sp.]|nr:tRNA pseudouridine(13) synthase TruD [Labilithrix sp.]
MATTLVRGRIKAQPEDFVVEEIPAYEPSGEGTHLFLHFEKKNLTTDAAVRAITRALGVEMREVGIAGMKDKVAVTTQWVSVPAPPRAQDIEAKAKALELEGIRVLEAKRHGNKLKTGHLRGNRFDIVVRGVAPGAVAEAVATIERIAREGVPNAFGVQRFGKEGDNAQKARAWLTGQARAPGDPRLRRFHFSALQSAVFNAVLDARVADGTWAEPQEGDVLKKEDTGGLFLCTDVQADRERAGRGELCPTGPIVGDKMRSPEGAVRALEERIAAPWLEGVDLQRARSLGEGTRRALRLSVTECTVAEVMDGERPFEGDREEQGRDLRVRFVLPKGAYATTVLSNAFDLVDGSRETDTRTEEE